MMLRDAGWVTLGSIGAAAAYLRLIRPWQLRWGATDAEVERSMPGDDDVPRPTFNATRAVTVAARPEQIWPWLIQIGVGRAGWYSYDWLDNLGRHSAERIIPEFQHLAVGDVIPMSPDGKHGNVVKAFEPNRWMLWGDQAGQATWYWGLYPVDERQTRLITRVRMCYRWTSPLALFNPLVEFADIAMMRKCLLGIKRRAEASTLARAVGAADGDFRDWAAINVWAQEIAEAVPTTRAPADGHDVTAEPLSALRRVK